MAHVRERIRKAVRSAVTGLATTRDNVFSAHEAPFDNSQLPCVTVAVAIEPEVPHEEDEQEMGDFEFRILPIETKATVKVGAGLEDTLDDITAEVETAIFNDALLKSLSLDIRLMGTTIEVDNEAEIPVGTASQEWNILHKVNRKSPITA